MARSANNGLLKKPHLLRSRSLAYGSCTRRSLKPRICGFLSRPFRVGLFGGSFDPVHKGHMAIARAALKELGLDELWFIPCRQNPLKSTYPVASDRDRLKMLRLASESFPGIRVSDWEIRQKGPSYTYRTIGHFKKCLPKGTELYWIIGSDLAPELHRWKRWDLIKRLCRFACVARGGEQTHRLPAEVLCFKMKPVQVSSSGIQRKVAGGGSVRKELPAQVAEWIRRRRLYRQTDRAAQGAKNKAR